MGKRMISKEIICEVKRDKFYRAVEGVKRGDYFSIFYLFVIYFRYKSFVECLENQNEKDLAYLSFYDAKKNMWWGIFLGIFMLFMITGIISTAVMNSNG